MRLFFLAVIAAVIAAVALLSATLLRAQAGIIRDIGAGGGVLVVKADAPRSRGAGLPAAQFRRRWCLTFPARC